MGKVRKCKLCWKRSKSKQVVGYRLYWTKDGKPSYDSHHFDLGDVNEVVLPDVLKLNPRYPFRIMLGISAVDIYENESDILSFPEPYTNKIPLQPTELSLTEIDEFETVTADNQ